MAGPHLELNSSSPTAIDGRQIRAVAFQDVRLEYVRRTLDRLGRTGEGSRALVVGSGRGLLARGLAGLGLDVTALDPSATAAELARDSADRAGLRITHEVAHPEDLGVPEGHFDIAYYADTFEITHRLDDTLAQASAALRPGGLLIYDTVHRTVVSRLLYLVAFQSLPMTRIMPRGHYSAARLRAPAELTAALGRHQLASMDICTFTPTDPRNLIRVVLARRRGEITDDEIPSMVKFTLTPEKRPVVTYLGHALKDPPSPPSSPETATRRGAPPP